MKLNKKGFTLIELLAVIVILAIIIVIASSNVGGLMTTARKNALASEGNSAVRGAQLAYQSAILNGDITTNGACFSLKYLYDKGYYTKGAEGSDYTGSVKVTPDDNGLNYTYNFWISNGSYVISNATFGANGSSAQNGTGGSPDCGGTGVSNPSTADQVKLFS